MKDQPIANEIPALWAVDAGTGDITVIFPADQLTPEQMAMLQRAAQTDPWPTVRWDYRPQNGVSVIAWKMDPTPPFADHK